MKICSKCLVEKSESEYSKNGSRLRSYCKECARKPGVKPRVKVINGEKLCSGCNLVKPISEYFIRKDRPSGVVSRCKTCESERSEDRVDDIKQYSRTYYEKNKDKICAKSKSVGDERMKYIYEYKINKPCVDCKQVFPPVCMDFDHIPEKGNKTFNLSQGRWKTIEVIKEELDKCELVCANCHRLRTLNRGTFSENAKLRWESN